MAKQYHFTVHYDTDTQEFFVEEETMGVQDRESVWDTETETWEQPNFADDCSIFSHLVSMFEREGAVSLTTMKEREQ